MANTAWAAAYPKWNIGGTVLAASTAFTTTSNCTGVTAGKGFYMIRVVASAIEIASNNEIYGISIQADTKAADGTYTYEIGRLVLGALEVCGVGTDDIAATYWFGVYNPYDNHIRARVVCGGTTNDSTGLTCTIDAFPIATTNA